MKKSEKYANKYFETMPNDRDLDLNDKGDAKILKKANKYAQKDINAFAKALEADRKENS